jgi:hypothetical protein
MKHISTNDLARLRLFNQRLFNSKLMTPAGVVAHLGAIQAQDYDGDVFSIGLRLPGLPPHFLAIG